MVKRARKANTLALPTRKPDPALADSRVKPIGQFRFDELEHLRKSTRFAQSSLINLLIRQTECDVARDRVVGEKNILWNVTDRSLPWRHQRRREQLSIDQYLACRWVIETKQQIDKR